MMNYIFDVLIKKKPVESRNFLLRKILNKYRYRKMADLYKKHLCSIRVHQILPKDEKCDDFNILVEKAWKEQDKLMEEKREYLIDISKKFVLLSEKERESRKK